jgi:hypothetical protein
MRKKTLIFSVVALSFLDIGLQVQAESSATQNGSVTFEGDLPTPPRDPDKPDNPVNPGPIEPSRGDLRLILAPQLDFGRNEIVDSNMTLYTKAQLFKGGQPARANYVEVVDERAEATGWTLRLKQETQFTSTKDEKITLEGAQLSFVQPWASSTEESQYAPNVREAMKMLPGNDYVIATADKGKGMHTWMISFGDSKENVSGRGNTLVPVTENGKQVTDGEYGPVFLNKAIELFVPENTKKEAVDYQTILTWTLLSGPEN